MSRAGVLQGVRQMRFEGLLERHERGELSQGEAAEMLGVSERTFRRWRDRLRDEGPEGLRDRRIGKPSSRRAAVEEILRMLGLYEERYAGFTVPSSSTSIERRHANSCMSLISPRYSTCRCTTRPRAVRVFSTTLQ